MQYALASREQETIADRVVQMVGEMDDRTSPEDWPEAMLVTGPELHAFILMAFECAAESRQDPQAIAAREQESINTTRLAWLHTSNKDADGYEYGVCKVRFDPAGKMESFLWTASDSSDVDAAMSAAGVAK